MKKITIGYVSDRNPFEDRRAWSGLIFKIREAIEDCGYKVVWIPYQTTSFWIKLAKIPYTILSKMTKTLILRERTPIIGYLCAKTIKHDEVFNSCDYFFFSDQSPVLAYFKSTKPIIYYSDAIFDIMVNYYWFNMHKTGIAAGRRIDIKAMNNASIILHSSEWASNAAHKLYNIPQKKLHVLEFGANLDKKLIDEVRINKSTNSNVFNILFTGIDWKRKGGDVAIETTRLLNENGINAVLHIVGISNLSDEYKKLSYIENHGFLNKDIKDEYVEYIKTISSCNILLLPTKAECSATVYCEAAAFGIPVYTYDTGGIANYVINGINGYRIPLSGNSQDFCNTITESIVKDEIKTLGNANLRLYKDKLSWEAWSARFKTLLNNYSKKIVS